MGLLAEQIVVDCEPSTLEDLFLQRRATWLVPLLRLAGDEGEAAGLVLLGERAGGDRRQAVRRRAHQVAVRPEERSERSFRVGLRWRTTDYRALFSTFDGTLRIRALEGHAVMSVEGLFTAPTGAPPGRASAPATRRAAEVAVRSLLGHLRAAVEERSASAG